MWTFIFGVIAGFFAWIIVLIGGEQMLSVLLPEQFGKPQAAFQKTIEEGGAYSAQSTHLVMHVGLALAACLGAGFVVASITGHQTRAAWVLGIVLLCVGLTKAALTWKLVPIWYHIAFTGVLLPATLIGASIHRPSAPNSPPSAVRKSTTA